MISEMNITQSALWLIY